MIVGIVAGLCVVIFGAACTFFYFGLKGVIGMMSQNAQAQNEHNTNNDMRALAIMTEMERFGQLYDQLNKRVAEIERVGVNSFLGNVRGKED